MNTRKAEELGSLPQPQSMLWDWVLMPSMASSMEQEQDSALE